MSYAKKSNWNDFYELECLIIFKKLEGMKFPRGKQMQLCRELSKMCPLSKENLSAKVSNFKTLAGINNRSNASTNTVKIYQAYKDCSIPELQKILSIIDNSPLQDEGRTTTVVLERVSGE